jgi:hypothetical protein
MAIDNAEMCRICAESVRNTCEICTNIEICATPSIAETNAEKCDGM